MNHNIKKTGLFRLDDIFNIKYGVNLELVNCVETTVNDKDGVPFIARTEKNNGLVAYVKPTYNKFNPAGSISVAGGGSVLSCFYQDKHYYSGRDLFYLTTKTKVSKLVKLYLCSVIEMNKYKYSFGRQANKTMRALNLQLPITDDGTPDWQFMENYIKSLNYKLLTTKNQIGNIPKLEIAKWKEFRVGDLFDKIHKGNKYNKDELNQTNIFDNNKVNYITRTAEDNGCEWNVINDNFAGLETGNAITIGDTTATCFYHAEQFICGDHMIVMRSNWLNKYTGLFIVSLLQQEKYRYNYGRAFVRNFVKNTKLKLPVTTAGEPDWQWMEDYIKTLPYGDRI